MRQLVLGSGVAVKTYAVSPAQTWTSPQLRQGVLQMQVGRTHLEMVNVLDGHLSVLLRHVDDC